jgi:hypothetical protein
MSKTAVFLTGSTKGAHVQVAEKFKRVATELRQQGYKVTLPTVIGEPTASWDASIRSDITALMHCDEIHLMHNWQGHRRSEILRDTALRIGIKAVYH